MDAKSNKTELRAKYRKMREEIFHRGDAEGKNAIICKRMLSLQAYKNADTVLIYYPIKSEIDVLPIALDAINNGKKVAFPISEPDGFKLIFKTVSSPHELEKGRYGIYEPPKNAEDCRNTEKAICIVPGLAFDREGYRIGYGRGYYDRFLSSFKGVSVGLVYSDLMSEGLPRENTDVSVDIIITEKEELYL